MLASTVQFSNNDQTPTLGNPQGLRRMGPASQKEQSFPQDPTACPVQDHHPPRSTPKQY
ncbi:hypothetical protein BX265_2158 [Streptomyces sp. TLI_235]|nr:hypothetical protein BX265_2158 [Streptomyces sp. TLI_235]